MNLLLLGSLFVVGVMICVRSGERILSLAVAALAVGLAALLGALALGGGGLGRAQGVLVAVAVVAGSAAFRLGGASASGGGLRLPGSPRTLVPTGVRRTASAPPPRPLPTVPDLNFQDYEVLDRVGIGGMGSVYRARRRLDGRIVALKVPQEKYLADARFVKRFYREAEVLKRFNHPGVVRVYDYRMEAPEHYIAMEFLDGESLEALLESRPLSFAEAAQVLRALADALRHIHLHNVVHRDIKPANVMVLRHAFVDGKLREGGVKLMDFGIAVGKVLTRLTMTGTRVGTPVYMAPEQAKGNRVDARSDVYSLGLLAYEMATGQPAFKGSYEAVVHQQVFETPKPPKQVRMEVPGKLADLILHMIEKDPEDRPTLDEVIARLDAGVLEDEAFTDPLALALSVTDKRGTLRVLDLRGRLRLSLRNTGGGEGGLPGAPGALAADTDGHLYAALLDFRQGKTGALIRRLAPDGREVAAFGPYGLGEGELLQPVSLAVTRGHVYVLDGETHHVVVYDTHGRFVRRFGGRGQGLGRFENPRAIAAAPDGQIYVLDGGNREVQRFSPQGEYLSRYAFRRDRESDALRELEGLGVDGSGAVYIVDGVARRVRRIEPGGKPGASFALEPLVGEPEGAPWLLQIDAGGQVYLVRRGGQVLRTYSAAGDLIASQDMYAPVQALTLLPRPTPVPA
ncbi:serine/threonine protein kinase [Deinococcus aetherius]|uniref:Serine/threonine protein kinase n=1 Tax=Deinococcus aetherius TaxID=200252 RepID=A0ABN6RGM1_9DEIO|nr:protein kinase [Deinococcus aetherius]BDP42004.1 serine/threonine protein kinase [Deinococcus aetherius]